jgi:NAD(P)-dependent dehydrogenase (short-subunit alcohol dehydrogenase family)
VNVSSFNVLDELTQSSGQNKAKRGIRVNLVNPGFIVTHLQKPAGMSESKYQEYLKTVLTSRIRSPLWGMGENQKKWESS